MPANCLYCTQDQLRKELMIEICKLDVSTVYLFREQSHYGRCIVTFKDHNIELFELSDADLLSFMKDVNRVATVINNLFKPDKINYGAYSDKLKHLHMHLVPKYTDGLDFGNVFLMNPKQTYLKESEYEQMADKIRTALNK